jgi:hypothetical protein
MDKNDLRIIEIKFYKKLDEIAASGRIIQLTPLNMIAILEDMGYIRSKPIEKVVDMELDGDTHKAKEE